MTAPITAPHRADPLVAALTQRFLSDPKLINDVVTGACCWPSEEGAAWLYVEAVDQVKDLEEFKSSMFRCGFTDHATRLHLDQLIAARDALAIIANTEDEQRQAAERRFNDGPSVKL